MQNFQEKLPVKKQDEDIIRPEVVESDEPVNIYVEYDNGRRREEELWERSDLCCPSCGKKSVWVGGADDYYLGQDHICTSCDSQFSLPRLNKIAEAGKDFGARQRLAQLKKF